MDIFESWLLTDTITRCGLVTESEPESSKGAFDNAIKNNAAIMINVQSLDDENLVCFSYKNVAKLTDGSGYVQTLSLDKIQELKIKNTKYNVLSLKDALSFIDGKVPLLINIFNDGAVGKIETNLCKILKSYNGEFAVMSTNPYTIEWFKNNVNNVVRGIKSGKMKEKHYGSFKTKKLAKLKYNKICDPQFIVYNACDLPNRVVNKYKNLPIIAYNVASEQEYLRVVMYCDNAICDGFIPKI